MTIINKILKSLTSILSNLNKVHSLKRVEIVNRVSETQLQVGENYNSIIWWLALTTLK